MNFLLRDYSVFVAGLLGNGYECLSFADARADETAGKHLLLRHDIDIDPVAALPMARTEANIGAQSTYYVLLSNRHTNPFASEFRDAVAEIYGMGHWIGLHFDATQYELSADDPRFNERVHYEVNILAHLCSVPVESVSFHRPARELIGSSSALTTPLRHTYEAVFMNDIEYCSDSSGTWAYGPPEDRAAVRDGKPFHFLTHPIWWGNDAQNSDDAQQPHERIEAWMRHRYLTDLAHEMPTRWTAP